MNWILDTLGPDLLTPPALMHLRAGSLLSDEDVISIELSRMVAGCAMEPGEVRIASLFHDESSYVPYLLQDLVGAAELTARESETILIARLLHVRRSWDTLDEAGFYIESEIDDWDSDGEYEALRFSMLPSRGEGGVEKYLARLDAHVRHRIAVLKGDYDRTS